MAASTPTLVVLTMNYPVPPSLPAGEAPSQTQALMGLTAGLLAGLGLPAGPPLAAALPPVVPLNPMHQQLVRADGNMLFLLTVLVFVLVLRLLVSLCCLDSSNCLCSLCCWCY